MTRGQDEPVLVRVRPSVARFATAMERKLQANDHKPHWLEYPQSVLRTRVDQELKELDEAVAAGDLDNVLPEAADVANFLMFITEGVAVMEVE